MKISVFINQLKRIHRNQGDMIVKSIDIDGKMGDPRVYSEHNPGEKPYLSIRAKDPETTKNELPNHSRD